MELQPQEEHKWLEQLVGEWTYESEATMEPGKPPMKCSGTESVRSLGGLWVLCEGRGDMPDGGQATAIITLGYDPAKKRYVGTFVGSMMTHLWLYEGTLDPAGKRLTLDTEGPNWTAPGKMARYQDIIEIKSADDRVLTSRLLGDDGKWHTIMRANYQRSK